MFSRLSPFITSLILVTLCGLAACTAAEPTPPPTPTLSSEQITGKRVFASQCGSCHSIDDETVIVGPAMGDIATRAKTRVPGQDARAYLYNSILNPSDYLVEGFNDGLMPQTLAKQMTGEEMDAVIAYLLTLE